MMYKMKVRDNVNTHTVLFLSPKIYVNWNESESKSVVYRKCKNKCYIVLKFTFRLNNMPFYFYLSCVWNFSQCNAIHSIYREFIFHICICEKFSCSSLRIFWIGWEKLELWNKSQTHNPYTSYTLPLGGKIKQNP